MNKQLLPVVILAGGLGTRLYPITKVIPKALVEINGKPFIYHQLLLLREKGICQVVICVGYLGEQIVEFLGDGSHLDLSITYSFDGDKLLGTAGAIKKALPLIDDNNFFVLYGDSYLNCNYLQVQNSFLNSQKLALMTVYHNQGQWDSSNVEYFEKKIIDYDKKNVTPRMKHIDYGLGVFDKKAFEYISDKGVCDLMVLYQALLKQEKLAAYEIDERFYEMGSVQGIKELAAHLAL